MLHQLFLRQISNRARITRAMLWLMYELSATREKLSRRAREMKACKGTALESQGEERRPVDTTRGASTGGQDGHTASPWVQGASDNLHLPVSFSNTLLDQATPQDHKIL